MQYVREYLKSAGIDEIQTWDNSKDSLDGEQQDGVLKPPMADSLALDMCSQIKQVFVKYN